MTLVAGADVAAGKWVCVHLQDGRFESASLGARLDALPLEGTQTLGVDIPLGLPRPESYPREADLEARARLGPRRASIFLTPPADVLLLTDYAEANARHRALTGKGLSKQTFHLFSKMREAERFASRRVLHEVHPELAFASLAGAPLRFTKKSWNGQREREALLRREGVRLPARLPTDVGAVAPDDLLDAAVVALVAHAIAAGRAEFVGPGPSIACLPGARAKT